MIGAGGDNNGEIVGLAQIRVEDDVVVHILSIVITHGAQETNLMVDEEQSGVVSVNPFKLVCKDYANTKCSSVTLHEGHEHR